MTESQRRTDNRLVAAPEQRQRLSIIGTPRSHDALLEILRMETPGDVLDVPSGTGVLGAWLRKMGWRVTCADIDEGNFQLAGQLQFEQVDLNRTLPFADESFDAVVCANGIHRVFNARGAMREMARVLRPGGRLFINMNNYATAANRLRYALYGTASHIFDEEAFRQTEALPEANVRIPITYSQVCDYMDRAGIRVMRCVSCDRSSKYIITNTLGAPLWLAAQIQALWSRDSVGLRRNATLSVLFGGRYIAIAAQKPELPR